MPRARKLHDEFFQKAKRDGYLARSAYKLEEINERKSTVRKGDRVLDLGCAPGSWLQVASRLVGPKGDVVGLDLKPVETEIADNVTALVGDMTEIDPVELKRAGVRPGRFNAVVSDMAPNTTGAGDDFRSVRLCRAILELLPVVIEPGGNLAMKVFEGAEMQDLIKETKALFKEAKAFKPKASRDVSRETYVVARSYTGPIVDTPEDANADAREDIQAHTDEEARRDAAEGVPGE